MGSFILLLRWAELIYLTVHSMAKLYLELTISPYIHDSISICCFAAIVSARDEIIFDTTPNTSTVIIREEQARFVGQAL